MTRRYKAPWPGAAGAAVPSPDDWYEPEAETASAPIAQPWTFRPPEARKPKLGRPRRSRWTRTQILAAVRGAMDRGEPTTQQAIAELPELDMSVETLRRIAGPWTDLLRDAELLTG